MRWIGANANLAILGDKGRFEALDVVEFSENSWPSDHLSFCFPSGDSLHKGAVSQ